MPTWLTKEAEKVGVEVRLNTAEDCLLGKVILQGSVVVCGGSEVGCETAELVAQRVRHVDIAEMKPAILSDSFHAGGIIPVLEKYHAGIYTNIKVKEITKEGVFSRPEWRRKTPSGRSYHSCNGIQNQ